MSLLCLPPTWLNKESRQWSLPAETQLTALRADDSYQTTRFWEVSESWTRDLLLRASLNPKYQMRKYGLVAVGGGLGSLIRFWITQWMATMPVWPFTAVLLINVTGCFLISFLNFLSDPSGEVYLGPNSRIFLLVGICGGYTTFSTFSLISFNAARHNGFIELWLNIGLSHLLCLLAIWLGAIAATQFGRIMMGWFRWLRR